MQYEVDIEFLTRTRLIIEADGADDAVQKGLYQRFGATDLGEGSLAMGLVPDHDEVIQCDATVLECPNDGLSVNQRQFARDAREQGFEVGAYSPPGMQEPKHPCVVIPEGTEDNFWTPSDFQTDGMGTDIVHYAAA